MQRLYLALFLLLFLSSPLYGKEGWKRSFEEEYLKIFPVDEAPKRNVCVSCHMSEIMRPELRTIPSQWSNSWHARNNISCHDCHGGDPEDEKNAMSPERGFIGKPSFRDVPQFCGRCHIGILEHYMKSGHGRSLRLTGHAPNCVTCHGSHEIQKASIEIINENLCSRCHSYERAKVMKQALSATERLIVDTDMALSVLKKKGMILQKENEEFFRTHAEFRALFHTTDVNLVKERTEEFIGRLRAIETRLSQYFKELNFRRNYSVFLFLLFLSIGIMLYIFYNDRGKK